MGGHSGNVTTRHSQVVSLDPVNHPVPECYKSRAMLPYNRVGGGAAVATSGKPPYENFFPN